MKKRIKTTVLLVSGIILILFCFYLFFFIPTTKKSFGELLNCSDGTLYDSCSINKPYLCRNGTLIEMASKCGCPTDSIPEFQKCKKVQRCLDSTEWGMCSSARPLFCDRGILINKSSKCGCPDSRIANSNVCISKYQVNPKEVVLPYILNGKKSEFHYWVYGGLNNYLLETPRTISYHLGESEPNYKDFIIKNIDDKYQDEFLADFVEKVKILSNNSDDQLKIIVSIVQNIPYDYNFSGSGRYAYQVLYDNKGVCGEKSPLLTYLLRQLGYGTALIDYGNIDVSPYSLHGLEFSHEAVGVKCPLQYSYKNTGYCFIETTSPSIITDSYNRYPSAFCLKNTSDSYSSCTQFLPDNFTLTLIFDGKSFDNVSEEYKDTLELKRLKKLSEDSDGFLSVSNYREWQRIIGKYGIKTLSN